MGVNEEDKIVASKAIAALRSLRSQPDVLLNSFTEEHRTIQQMTGGTLLGLINSIGKLYGGPKRSQYFDGRNEHLGKLCFEINTFMENHRHDMWYKLPVI